MSELKVHSIIGLDGRCNRVDNDYYLKAEADKVFAAKDEEIVRLDDLAHAHNIELLRKENLIEEKDAEIRRLKRALWLMGARLGNMGSIAYHNIKQKLYFLDDAEGVKWAVMKREQWENVERKCRAKAEEYQ